jgi:enoyl-[acyl-carrier protein] reductase/trans-2-enoyl-CoA reductase (NAD+)
MKEKGLHEGCIEQIMRLYRDRLYSAEAQADPRKIPTDSSGRIRLDDWEMREDVQKAVMEKMKNLSSENLYSETDLEGFRRDFLETHGFSAI